MRRVLIIAVLCALCGGAGLAQQSSSPAFEAASIKPTRGDTPGASFQFAPGGRFTMTNAPLRGLILTAFPTETGELVGEPSWLASDRYDVVAKAEGDPPRETMRMMLQALLRERLKLNAHYERQERPVYFLTLARTDKQLGPHLQQTRLDCDAIEQAARQGQQSNAPVVNDAPVCGMRVAGTQIAANGASLNMLTTNLRSRAGRVVIDRTGLSGRYDFTFEFAAQAGDPDRASIFTALEEQLGLKLEAGRAPLQVLVIDSVSRPTPD